MTRTALSDQMNAEQAMAILGLTKKVDMAQLFGVSPVAVSRWQRKGVPPYVLRYCELWEKYLEKECPRCGST